MLLSVEYGSGPDVDYSGLEETPQVAEEPSLVPGSVHFPIGCLRVASSDLHVDANVGVESDIDVSALNLADVNLDDLLDLDNSMSADLVDKWTTF